MSVAILTTTYNRSNTLKRLYESLLTQTKGGFTWYIIDDGSTDKTKDLVDSFVAEKRINIVYRYKANGGKHRAINYGIRLIKEKLTIFVDSDDWLTSNAIEDIIETDLKYKKNDTVAVYSFHKSYANGDISGPSYKEKEFIDNHISYRINHNIKGEKAEVVRTAILKKFLFPEIENENFLSEGYLWMSLAKRYNTVYVDKAIYNFEYQSNGITKNLKEHRFNNPNGVIETQKLYLDKKVSIIPRCKAMLRYIAYGKRAKRSVFAQYNDTRCKVLFVLLLLLGRLYYYRIRV